MEKINNKKCNGCGAYLNNQNDCIGYTPKNVDVAILCQACYQLKHYNKPPNNLIQQNEELKLNIEKLNLGEDKSERFLSVIVTDIYNIGMMSKIEKISLAKNVLICINKIELIPYNYQKLLLDQWTEFAKKFNKKLQIILISSYTNYGMSILLDIIRKYNEVTFYGQTGVGKSSIINWLMKKNKIHSQLSTGSFLNTTKNILANKIGHTKIIDTPGFNRELGIFKFLNANCISNLQEANWKQFVFQIHKPKAYFLENFLAIVFSKVDVNNKASLIANLPTNITIHKTDEKNLEKFFANKYDKLITYDENCDWKSLKLEINKNTTFLVDDLGWFQIKTNNIVEITIYLPNDVKISQFK